jgi:ATP-dependent DNA helicase RecG
LLIADCGMLDLNAPVQFVKGVGPDRGAALAREGIATVEDLLLRLPLRYEDRTRSTRIGELKPGMRTSVCGRVAVAGLRRTRRMPVYEVLLQDDTGRLKAIWFNQPYLRDTLPRGSQVVLFGDVHREGGTLLMTSPQFEKMDAEDGAGAGVHTGRIVPVYEKTGPLTSRMLRRILFQLAAQVPDDLPDPLPPEVRERLGLIARGVALRRVHVPGADDDVAALDAFRSPAHLRLIQEELFLFQLGLALRKQGRQARGKGIAFSVTGQTREAVKRILPFRLTDAQRRVLREIADDMQSPHPMNRLVQGDVGSGKTIVALLAMVIALENGYQAAFMAPTEILAEQHFLNLKRLLQRCDYPVELLSASALSGKRKRSGTLERLASGECRIAVGTHALIQEGVSFARLGLVVVDEQHRFGVLQREELMRKGYDVDVLVMTATPIPRTLALTAYGDLDVSVLDALPPGRTPIATLHRAASDRRAVVDLVRREVEAGRQAYVVYPLVSESEKLEDVRAATQSAEEWRQALPGARVGLLHGRLKGPEKEQVMAAFAAGELQVLVATTVIEVGVDVPNATVMVIEHAERFGLAQLHQLRGRVGRGAHRSTCVLVAHGRVADEARARLEVMVRTGDGFVIAEKDLELRGPGDVFGTRQWGLPQFRAADFVRDRELMERARAEAFRWAAEAEKGGRAESLRQALQAAGWERRFGLARVG